LQFHVREALSEFEPGEVDRFPAVGGERAAHRARIFARRLQAREDARRIARIGDHEVQHVLARARSRMTRVEHVFQLGYLQHRTLRARFLLGRLRQERAFHVDVEHARGVLGALHVTRHPEQVIGGSAQHVIRPSTYLWSRRLATN